METLNTIREKLDRLEAQAKRVNKAAVKELQKLEERKETIKKELATAGENNDQEAYNKALKKLKNIDFMIYFQTRKKAESEGPLTNAANYEQDKKLLFAELDRKRATTEKEITALLKEASAKAEALTQDINEANTLLNRYRENILKDSQPGRSGKPTKERYTDYIDISEEIRKLKKGRP